MGWKHPTAGGLLWLMAVAKITFSFVVFAVATTGRKPQRWGAILYTPFPCFYKHGKSVPETFPSSEEPITTATDKQAL